MIFNKYIVFILSTCLLFYSLYKFKGERLLKKIYITASILGLYGSISRILYEDLKIIDEGFKDIALFPGYFGIAGIFYLLIIYNWRHRKEPERKIALYVGSIALIVAAILFVIVYLRLKK